MSELKAKGVDDVYLEYFNTGKHDLAQVYLKSEADKVIADKDAKILALDAEVAKQKHHAKLFFDERNYAEARLRHHKYHRCLDMAAWCKAEADAAFLRYNWDSGRYAAVDFYEKWHKRWLEIATKFKEAGNDQR